MINVPNAAAADLRGIKHKFQRAWGSQGWDSLLSLTEALSAREIFGPTSLKEPLYFGYILKATPSIACQVLISDDGCSDERFRDLALSVCVKSKTIFDLTPPSAPWYRPNPNVEDDDCPGYEPCLTIALAHLKWATHETSERPVWAMSTNGIKKLIEDFDVLMIPILKKLASDDALLDLLKWALAYERPSWVRSSRPGFANIDTKTSLLSAALTSSRNCSSS